MRTSLKGVAATFLLSTLIWASAEAARLGYDPKADPFEQYHAAIERAGQEGKLVLVIAGGDWCSWCHVLNRFLERNETVRRELEDTFVVMKVYVGEENYNEDFFDQLPAARGAPHFWIISPDKHVLASQPTGAFESGRRGYDEREFLEFIARWKQHVIAMR
ncbi:MAG TPA: thioredoxin family protein [Steroidobacter sp.]